MDTYTDQTKVKQLYEIFLKTRNISINTKSITPGAIFFAQKGLKVNSNQLAQEALDKGAEMVVLDDPLYYQQNNPRHMLCHNTLQILSQVALHHRRHLKIPFIAITGSAGKTTSKDMTLQLLAQKYGEKVRGTEKNMNTLLTIPITMLNLDKENTEIAVIEIGANHLGDIRKKCELVQPTHGAITNIGRAHVGEFGGLQALYAEKTQLYKFLDDHSGVIFINADDKTLMERSKPNLKKSSVVQYNCLQPQVFPKTKLIQASPFIKIEYRGHQIQTNIYGAYNYNNIVLAIQIAQYFKVSQEDICRGLKKLTTPENRSRFLQNPQTGNIIIQDAYNASPESVLAAIQNFGILQKEMHLEKPKAIILGQMGQLGQYSHQIHNEVFDEIFKHNFQRVILVGSDLLEIWSKSERKGNQTQEIRKFETTDELVLWLHQEKINENFILLKGSRSMCLQRCLSAL